ncbi:YIP1 family protein [Rhodovulum adriaticum]|uniref:Yip1-like protein n=1 Tax=Rhodovulum adriaticum TaxID=35804 RepID=A0A4R2NND4_RHOAD|nr:YIP1 family protein [Rhodovulum adriaticum]MBK1634569.1 YIP1 family protein [Rhodovulum adriaticum]TCP23062.1 hypothetical protein EV656_10431 [Rhodovulum adriaticum]
MSLTLDIVATWRAPRVTIRRLLAGGPREDRAIVFVMLACALIFVAQWPRLVRQAHFDDSIPLQALLGSALFVWLFLMPLFFYGLAAFSHLFARMVGGTGSWFGARLALFWALLCTAPLGLLHGLVAGFLGAGAALNLVGVLVWVAFLAIWLLSLAEAEGLGRT